ncbi:MAG: hypothetical protein NTW95_14465 [Candidatus Aminicenantes bacterium]|nr:hypothetical protein [Candidatus Aminicenantes bacterium]
MKKLILALALLVLALPQAIAADTRELARQVRETETAFAKTMADRDWAAFKAFVSLEAIFFGRRGILRGHWRIIFDKGRLPALEVLKPGRQ